jgi:hypothetical protein
MVSGKGIRKQSNKEAVHFVKNSRAVYNSGTFDDSSENCFIFSLNIKMQNRDCNFYFVGKRTVLSCSITKP